MSPSKKTVIFSFCTRSYLYIFSLSFGSSNSPYSIWCHCFQLSALYTPTQLFSLFFPNFTSYPSFFCLIVHLKKKKSTPLTPKLDFYLLCVYLFAILCLSLCTQQKISNKKFNINNLTVNEVMSISELDCDSKSIPYLFINPNNCIAIITCYIFFLL